MIIKNSTQLKDKIRNMAKKHNGEPLVLMRTYMMERFLERLTMSPYRDNFILKGGMLVAAMVGLGTRSTTNTRMRDLHDIYMYSPFWAIKKTPGWVLRKKISQNINYSRLRFLAYL